MYSCFIIVIYIIYYLFISYVKQKKSRNKEQEYKEPIMLIKLELFTHLSKCLSDLKLNGTQLNKLFPDLDALSCVLILIAMSVSSKNTISLAKNLYQSTRSFFFRD